MTTLEAIGFTTAGSAIVAMGAFLFFSFAVRVGSPKVAPRCTARSQETIYNPKAKRKKSLFSFLFCWNKRRKTFSKNHKKDDSESGIKIVKKIDPNTFSAGAGATGVNKKGERTNLGSNHADHNGKENDDEDDNKDHVQYRGGPMLGWIPWTLSLSYEQLLKGVPGTGTRKNGMEGSMLKVNLDGIVLLRFHGKFMVFFY